MLIVKEKYILYFWLNRRHWDGVGVGHWEGCPDYYRINRGNCYGCLGSDEQRLTLLPIRSCYLFSFKYKICGVQRSLVPLIHIQQQANSFFRRTAYMLAAETLEHSSIPCGVSTYLHSKIFNFLITISSLKQKI